MPQTSIASRWQKTWPFTLLCVGAAGVWLLPETFPQVHFDLRSAAFACALAAVVSLLFAHHPCQAMQPPLFLTCIGGAMVLIGPSVGIFLNAADLGAGALTISLALTSVVVAVAASAWGTEKLPEDRLWPGLFAAAGLLLAITMPSLHDIRSDAAMLLAPLFTGMGCVLYKRVEYSAAWKAAGSCLLAAIVFAVGAAVDKLINHGGQAVSLAAAGVEAILFLLALLALQRLSSMQYTARYALVPLLLMLEGPALLSSPLINYRNLLCAATLLIATIVLLKSKAEENVVEESLKGDGVRR